MEELNLPVFKEPGPPPPIFSMDEYFQFVEFYVEHLLDQKAYQAERKKSVVTVPFRLR